MQRLVAAFIVLAFACACAIAAKNPPTWPTQFSTGIDKIQRHPHKVMTGRWYYDQTQKADRFDTHHGETIEVEINRYDLKTRYNIRWTAHQQPTCKSTPLSGDMPMPNFAGWTYGGTKQIRGATCDSWTHTTQGATIHYFDRTDTNDPVQFMRKASNEQQWDEDNFYEFDRAPQDPQMFNISYVFPEGCKAAEPEQTKTNTHQSEEVMFVNNTDVGCSPISCGAMQSLVRKYFPGNYQTDMICIAFYESSWCPDVYNGICCYGLWQINSNHLGEPGCPRSTGDLMNADVNAQCAAHVLKSQGLNAWQTWASGDCTHWSRCNA